jgi:hypothetical protein
LHHAYKYGVCMVILTIFIWTSYSMHISIRHKHTPYST